MSCTIDYSKCMSIKSKKDVKTQCKYSKKHGDYCKIHFNISDLNITMHLVIIKALDNYCKTISSRLKKTTMHN